MRTTDSMRRFALTLAVAGVATVGGVAVAPAASAAPVVHNGPAYVIDGNGNGGPDAFIVTGELREPVFYCDPAKPMKRHNICIAKPTPNGPRF